MSDILSNTSKVIISFFVALFLNKLLSVFRKRQLYLSCWNRLENTAISDNAFTINASIYNNGKEKEKSVVIQMPPAMTCSVVSCDHDYKNHEGKIVFDRVLPRKKISLIILVEGERTLNKHNKPRMKSEDADGKVYLTNDIVPPSAGILTFFLAFSITIFGGLTYLISTGVDPVESFQKAHNTLFYNDYYNSGITFNPVGSSILTDQYHINANEYPIELVDARKLNGIIEYKFRVVNKYKYPMTVSAKFKIDDEHGFWRSISKAGDMIDKDAAKKEETNIYTKYHVNFQVLPHLNELFPASEVSVTVKENSIGYLIVSRVDYPYLTMEDMNIDLKIKASSDGENYETVELLFLSNKNKLTQKLF